MVILISLDASADHNFENMKDNFLKLGILGGRDVPFDTSLFSLKKNSN
jgi:hypothetical protein